MPDEPQKGLTPTEKSLVRLEAFIKNIPVLGRADVTLRQDIEVVCAALRNSWDNERASVRLLASQMRMIDELKVRGNDKRD